MKRFLTVITFGVLSLLLGSCNNTQVQEPINFPTTEVIIVNENQEVEVGDATFNLMNTFQIEGEVLSTSIDSNGFDVFVVGNYDITITVVDNLNVTHIKTYTIDVVDTEPPTITLYGSKIITLNQNTDYFEQGANLQDNYDTELKLVSIGNIDTTKTGEYRIEYYTIDSSFNKSDSLFRTIIVVASEASEVVENGKYISKDNVALYIFTYHKLPSNYMTKSEAGSHISEHWTNENMASIGGDVFHNREGLLPETSGRTYVEVDINYQGGSRNAERIVYSNDGFIFYTDDHYDSFKLYDPVTGNWINYNKNDSMFD